MATRYVVTYVDKTGRGVYLHTDAPPSLIGSLVRTLSGVYQHVEVRCGNAYPTQDDRGALLWLQGCWTTRGDKEVANYIERK